MKVYILESVKIMTEFTIVFNLKYYESYDILAMNEVEGNESLV